MGLKHATENGQNVLVIRCVMIKINVRANKNRGIGHRCHRTEAGGVHTLLVGNPCRDETCLMEEVHDVGILPPVGCVLDVVLESEYELG